MKWLLVALTIAVALFLLANFDATTDQSKQEAQVNPSDIEFEYYGHGVRSSGYNMDGQLNRQIVAQRTAHDVETGETLLHDIQVLAVSSDQRRWTIQSGLAQLNEQQELVLSQKVDILPTPTQQSEPTFPSIRIRTEQLVYHHQQQLAETELTVNIQGDGLYIEAQGLEFDFNQQTLLLKRNVISTFQLD